MELMKRTSNESYSYNTVNHYFNNKFNFLTMKFLKCVLIYVLIVTAFDCMARDEASLNLHFPGHTHGSMPMPAEMPDVYYNNVSQTIIIDGTGEVDYYDVEIMSLTTFDVVISTQVNGYYDTIDISSLPDGEYAITIDAPTGNSFEGRLDNNIKD